MNPLVSILISSFNRPDTVIEAVDSCLNQTYQNIEIILTRDGGTELPIADMKYDNRLTIIDREENYGIAKSFNHALDVAKGEYICYLGDDDLFYPNHVQVLLDAIHGSKYGLVYSDLYKVHYRQDKDGTRTPLSKNVEVKRDFDRMSFLRFNNALHVSIMHRKDLFIAAGKYNESLVCLIDWDLTRKMCFYTDFLHVPVVTGEYYSTPFDIMTRVSMRERNVPHKFMINMLKIRTARPPKPWPKIKDLAIVITSKGDIRRVLREIWSLTWYPYQVYLVKPIEELRNIKTPCPHIIGIPCPANMQENKRFDIALNDIALQKEDAAELIAVVPPDYNCDQKESWVETALYALLKGNV